MSYLDEQCQNIIRNFRRSTRLTGCRGA